VEGGKQKACTILLTKTETRATLFLGRRIEHRLGGLRKGNENPKKSRQAARAQPQIETRKFLIWIRRNPLKSPDSDE
jgi:hypothetical protein